MLSSNLKKFIVDFNNRFPLDRWFRQKYKIPFNSEQHLSANQTDILLEYIEEVMFKEHEENVLMAIENKKLIDKGEWIKESVIDEEELDEQFDKIEI